MMLYVPSPILAAASSSIVPNSIKPESTASIKSIFIISFAENYEWTVINNYDAIETNTNSITESTSESDKGANTTENAIADSLNLECESAILIEQNSGQVLYEKNPHEQLRPASVTKLMSLLLIFEALEKRSNNTPRQSSM